MSCLSCRYTTLASSSSSSSPDPPPARRTKPSQSAGNKQKQLHLSTAVSKQRKKLSIIQMERAIGAGTFRDTEPRDLDKEKVVFNGVLPDFSRMFEGPVEKKVRETGQWVATNSEKAVRSSRKGTLMVFMQWILPIWTLSLLLASGAIKLPFNVPLLDDLVM